MDATANKTKETLNDGGKMVKNVNAALMDMYSKQLNLATGFYTNFLNSAMSNITNWDKDGSNKAFQNSDLTKSFTNLFTNNNFDSQNPFLSAFNQISGQLAEYNRNLFIAFNQEMNDNKVDWTKISRKYKEAIESRLEAYRNIFKSASEAYNHSLDSSIEINQKMMEDVTTELNSVFNASEKLWGDVLNTNKKSSSEESLKKESTHGHNHDHDHKKKSHVPERVSNHK